jgi:predicted nucleic acid-binding protein
VSAERPVILDANILVRAVLGRRVRLQLEKYLASIRFCTPQGCFEEARRNIPAIAARLGDDANRILERLQELNMFVEELEISDYVEYEKSARARMRSRDETDWPIVASALLLDCPIWTEDRDFFGCGVATWMTETVEIYLGS